MKKLEKLSPEQIALQAVVRDEWIHRALGGDTSLDSEAARQSVAQIYHLAGMKPPLVCIVDSPLGAQLAANILARASVRASVAASVRASVRASERASVWDSVRDSVRDSVVDSVWASVRASVRASVADSVADSTMQQFQWGYYSGLGDDAGWTAFYDYFQRIGVIPDNPNWDIWLNYMRLGVWDAIWLDGVAILVRRPKAVHKDGPLGDPRARLHSATRPAVEWANEDKHYFLHGMRVKAEWVESPESITVEQVLAQENVELRRAMVTLMKLPRFVREANADILDSDQDASGMPRRLLRIPFADDEPVVLVEVQCPSTGKIAHLRVPPSTTRCSQAVAWVAGFEVPDEYRPVVEA